MQIAHLPDEDPAATKERQRRPAHARAKEMRAVKAVICHDNGVRLFCIGRRHPAGFNTTIPGSTDARCRDTLTLRIPGAERDLIDRAAASIAMTRTDFIVNAARRAAEVTLLDRTGLLVNPAGYAEFLTRLDASPQPDAQPDGAPHDVLRRHVLDQR